MLELYSNDKRKNDKISSWMSFSNQIFMQNSQKKENADLKASLNKDTDLTDELFVRWRPVERLREYVKIKRLYNIPAVARKQKTKHLELMD